LFAGVVCCLSMWRKTGDEALENWEGLGNDRCLTCSRSQDSGKDVEDAGVKIGLDDGWKDLRGVNQCG